MGEAESAVATFDSGHEFHQAEFGRSFDGGGPYSRSVAAALIASVRTA